MLLRVIARNVVSILAGLIVTVLGLRIVFRIIALPVTSNFVGWIYDVSNQLLIPIERLVLLPSIQLSPGHILELSACLALAVYMVLASVLLWLLRRLFRSRAER